MGTELKVVPIYEQNFRNVPATLELLKQDCIEKNIPAIVTVCYANGDIDVRGMGDIELPEVLTLLVCAQQLIMGQMRAGLQQKSEEAAQC